MKARVIDTGDIVEATLRYGYDGKLWYEIDKSGYYLTDEELDFCFEREPDYWDKLLHQYAGMAMQSLIITSTHNFGTSEQIAMWANEYATALVKELKEGK